MKRGFTLIEIIIVIIIVGILAAVGMTQYSVVVEKGRIAEAKTRIGVMRQLAHEYYLNNGTFSGISDNALGANGSCSSNSYYSTRAYVCGATSRIELFAERCTSGGKSPQASAKYGLFMEYDAQSGLSAWCCRDPAYYGQTGSNLCAGSGRANCSCGTP